MRSDRLSLAAVVANGAWPDAAKQVIAHAGVEAEKP